MVGAVRHAIERLCLRGDAAARERAPNGSSGKGGARAAEAEAAEAAGGGGDQACPPASLLRQPLPAAPEPAGEVVCHAPWRLLKISERPLILVVDGFAPDCSELIALAAPLLARAKVGRGLGVVNDSRTCQLAWMTGSAAAHPAVVRLERRALQLAELACTLQGRRPLVLGESTQVLRYGEGERHSLHMDPFAERDGTRAATLHMYLNDVDGGGATSFPFAEPLPPHRTHVGCRVAPKRGRALLFWSRLHDGSEDQASRHEGEAVLRGTKSCATCWLNEPAPVEDGGAA